MCHMAPKRVFLKSQDFEFSQKRGVKKVKMQNLKKYFQNWIWLQKLDIKHVPHSPKEEKILHSSACLLTRLYACPLVRSSTLIHYRAVRNSQKYFIWQINNIEWLSMSYWAISGIRLFLPSARPLCINPPNICDDMYIYGKHSIFHTT